MAKIQKNLIISPKEFFKEKVTQAISEQKSKIDKDVEYYVVNLLCDFIEADKIFAEDKDIDFLKTPLALILKKAYESNDEKKLRIYKILGDTSLYTSGFFKDFFNNKPYDIEYFMSIGSLAFRNLSVIFERRNNSPKNLLFKEIADIFPSLVKIISYVSESSLEMKNSVNILEVYDKWMKNDSESLRKQLQKSGISDSYLKVKKQ